MLTEIDREANVAGLDRRDGLLGVRQQRRRATARSAARSARPTRPALSLTGIKVDTGAQRRDGRRHDRDRGRHARHRAGHGRHPGEPAASSPSAWRSRRSVNNKAAESRIRDANVAEESANLTRYNILTQSGIAALAQANQQSSSVLEAPRLMTRTRRAEPAYGFRPSGFFRSPLSALWHGSGTLISPDVRAANRQGLVTCPRPSLSAASTTSTSPPS